MGLRVKRRTLALHLWTKALMLRQIFCSSARGNPLRLLRSGKTGYLIKLKMKGQTTRWRQLPVQIMA